MNPSSAILLIVTRGNRASAATSVQAFRLQGFVTRAKPWVYIFRTSFDYIFSMCSLQVLSKLCASLYDVEVLSLSISSPFDKSGLFEVTLSEASDKSLLSSVSSSDVRSKSGGKFVMIPTSSLQKSKSLSITDYFTLVCYASIIISGSDDHIQMFQLADQSQIHLEPGYTTILTLKFVPLKFRARHCAIILRNKKLGDIVLSVYATVKHPKPILPESRCLNSSTIVNTQSRTLHLKANAGQTVDEEIIITRNNVAFENAMLEVSKWGMSDLEIKRRILSESFKSAILSTAIATLGLDHEPNSCNDQVAEGSEKIVFFVEGSDNKHFSHPTEVYLSANSGGKYV